MVLDDRRIKVRELAGTVGISKEYGYHILTKELHIRKLFDCSFWLKNAFEWTFSMPCLSGFSETSPIFCVDSSLLLKLGSTTSLLRRRDGQVSRSASKKVKKTVLLVGKLMLTGFFWQSGHSVHGLSSQRYNNNGDVPRIFDDIIGRVENSNCRNIIVHLEEENSLSSWQCAGTHFDGHNHEVQFELIKN